MKSRLDELMRTANRYKTKACGMHGMMGLIGPTSVDIEEQRNRRRRMARKPPVPKKSILNNIKSRSGSRSRTPSRTPTKLRVNNYVRKQPVTSSLEPTKTLT